MKAGSYIFISLLSLWFSVEAVGQQIWPGDVDNNGRVTGVDFLYWGYAYGSTGPARTEQGSDWQGYAAPAPWSQSFPNGVNFSYADADGDGEVDEDDEDSCIEENFGLEHGQPGSDGYQNAQTGSGLPKIILEPDVQAVEEGAVVNIALRIDDSQTPLDSFYGIAFTMTYSGGFIQDDEGPEFELLSGTWLDQDGEFAEELFVETGDLGQGALAITRTNQIAVPVGDGDIGAFQIVIEDIIVGLEVDTFTITIDSVRLVGPNLGTVPVIPDTATFLVAKDLNLITKTADRLGKPDFRIFPNPAHGSVFVEGHERITSIELTNALGRSMPLVWSPIRDSAAEVRFGDLPPGIYWITVTGLQAKKSKTLFIH